MTKILHHSKFAHWRCTCFPFFQIFNPNHRFALAMEITAILFVCTILALILKFSKKSRKAQLIDQLPGPPTVPIFGNSLQFVGVERCDRMKEVMKRDVQYGPIYRNWMINLPYVHITSAELAETVLNLKDVRKGQVYTFMQPWFGRGLLTSDGADWVRSRKLITPTFHFNILDTFLDTFNDNGISLKNKFIKEADTGKAVNIYPVLTLALLDSINETAMGNKIHALENADSVYVKAIYEMLKIIFYRYDHIWLHNDFFYKLSSTGRKATETLKILHGFTENTIRQRKQEREIQRMNSEAEATEGNKEKKMKVFLDLLLDECQKQNAVFSDKQVRDEVNTFMFEGHDTTTATICFTMLRLAHHPDWQEKIYEEQMALQGDRPDDWRPTVRDLNEMKILDMFIKETLRVHPPIPFISRTLTKDVQIGDYMIPEGSVTLISLVTILRDPKHFPDPEIFDPDRFLPENRIGRYAYAHIPFSAGPRNCIGMRFATATVKTFLSHIVRNVKILPVTRLEDLKVVIEIVQKPLTSLDVKFESRNKL